MVRVGLVLILASLIFVPRVWPAPDGADARRSGGAGAEAGTEIPAAELLVTATADGRVVVVRKSTGEILPPASERIEHPPALYAPHRFPSPQPCLAGGRRGAPAPGGGRLEAMDPCEFGRRLSELPICTTPEDCQAYQLWTYRFGDPHPRQALPPAPRRPDAPAARASLPLPAREK